MFLAGLVVGVALGAVLGVFGHQVYWTGLFDNLINPDDFREDDAPR